VSRTQVERWRNENGGAFPLVSGKSRRDDDRNAICLSISFPNYKMFYEQRQQGGEWVVIRLHAAILWELQCAFCYRNAASEYVRRTDIKKRESVGALKAMFADIPEGLRAKLGIPDRYATDPQAEVLVLESIPARYIESIYYQQRILTREGKQAVALSGISRRVDKRVFAPRIDEWYWKDNKENKGDAVVRDAPTVSPTSATNASAPEWANARPKQTEPVPSKRPVLLPPKQREQPAPSPVKSPRPKKVTRPSPLPAAKAPARGSTKSPQRSTPKQWAKPLERNAPEQKPIQIHLPTQTDQVHFRTIAKLYDMPLSAGRSRPIQRLQRHAGNLPMRSTQIAILRRGQACFRTGLITM
jgi:hypothetical protein